MNNSMKVSNISIAFFGPILPYFLCLKTLPSYLEVVGVLFVFVVLVGKFLECNYGFVYMLAPPLFWKVSSANFQIHFYSK